MGWVAELCSTHSLEVTGRCTRSEEPRKVKQELSLHKRICQQRAAASEVCVLILKVARDSEPLPS